MPERQRRHCQRRGRLRPRDFQRRHLRHRRSPPEDPRHRQQLLWRILKFGADAGNPDIAGDFADPDNDSVNNLLEYALNMEPLVAGTAGLPILGTEDGHMTLTYRPWRADLIYTVQVSSSVTGGWTSTGVTEVDVGGGFKKAIDPAFIRDNPGRFIRLKVTRL